MEKILPGWALRTAGDEDRRAVREALRRGTTKIRWPDLKALRAWAERQGWPTPRLGFEVAFLTRMLENEAGFALALRESGIGIQLPQADFTISAERLGELDALYDERSTSGRPTAWISLVGELREIRHAVEAGVAVTIEGGPTLRSWQGFYGWAHGRYHALEDGADPWIGDDAS